MGEDDLFHGRVHLFHGGQDALDISARIDDGGLAGGFTFDNGTVLLVGRYRHDGTLNGHSR